MMEEVIEIIPVQGIPLIHPGSDIVGLIFESIRQSKLDIRDGDIFVIAHTVVSKAEGRIQKASDITVSSKARKIAEKNDFDPIQVEIALNESQRVLRDDRALITETRNGHICNFSGVDHSNAPPESYLLLPLDADRSADSIRKGIEQIVQRNVAVVISDTEGRPWRKGAINIAIGCSGINAYRHNQGKPDLYGRILQRSLVCQIDQIASAAELIMGQADEGIPVVIVRGFIYEKGEETAKDIHRSKEENLFL